MGRSAWRGIGPAARTALAFVAILTAIGATCAPASAAVAPPSFGWPTIVAAADTTPPVITITSPTEGQHVALNGTLNAAYSCSDDVMVSSCTAGPVGTSPAGPHTFTVNATDTSGNPAAKTVNYVVDADTTIPVITITSPTEGQHVALNAVLNTAFSCADDGGSLIDTCTAAGPASTATAGPHTFTVNATDKANNQASKTVNYVVDPDTTAPVITITAPAEGQHFALGASASTNYACSDGSGSGIAIGSCAPTGPAFSTSTAGAHTFTIAASDVAGNAATKTVSYVVDAATDTTPPVITITSPTEGQHVALNSALTAEFSCLDAPGGSGANACTSNAVDTSTAGPHTFVVATSDNAGNTTTKTVNYFVDPDTTPPAITILTPTEGQHFALGAAVAGAFSCDGTGSAVSACDETAPLNTSTAGAHTYTVSATDAAGNPASKTVSYVVDAPSGGGGTGGGGTGTGTGTGGTGTGGTGNDSSSGAGTGSGPLARFALGALPASFTPSTTGTIRLLIRCTGPERCTGTAKITVPRKAATVRSAATATIVIASARYAVAAKKSARIVIKLNPIGRKRVRLSRTAVRATLTVTPSDRRIKAVKRSIKLKRATR